MGVDTCPQALSFFPWSVVTLVTNRQASTHNIPKFVLLCKAVPGILRGWVISAMQVSLVVCLYLLVPALCAVCQLHLDLVNAASPAKVCGDDCRFQLRCLMETPLHVQPGQSITGELRLAAHNRQSYDVFVDLTAPPLHPGQLPQQVLHCAVAACYCVDHILSTRESRNTVMAAVVHVLLTQGYYNTIMMMATARALLSMTDSSAGTDPMQRV